MKEITYENKWKKGERIGKGGQGLTYFCKLKDKNDEIYALKLLKEQRNQERRDRMFVEVSAMQILSHTNIPKYFDSNAGEYKNNHIDLYLVTEFIPGFTLQNYIENNGLLTLSDAISLSLNLTEIIAYCHLQGFCHRDIKPDNIIIKDNNINNPYLIDFGLSFNEDIPKNETPSWQHIGNRFLSLPELRVIEGNKKDRRSDVTMLCGIFLFCLTGIHPTDLIDESQTKPHRRERSKSILKNLNKAVYNALNRFFDIGFNLNINNRWQSAEAVFNALNELKNIEPLNEMDESNTSNKLDIYLKEIQARQDFKELENIKSLFNKCNETINAACQSVISKLESNNFGNIQGGYNLDLTNQIFINSIGIAHPYHSSLNFFPNFNCYVNGSELVLEANENGNIIEFFRFPLNEEIDWSSLKEKLKIYYINGITSKQE